MSMNIGPSWVVAHLGLKYPILALCVSAGIVGYSAYPSTDTGPMISITFDDGRESVMLARDMMADHDMVGTAYITSALLGTSSYIDHNQVVDLFSSGWEIGAHTITHPDLTELDFNQALYEVSYPASYLESLLGVPVFSFASPYGYYDENVISMVEPIYDSHVNAWSSNRGLNYRTEFNPMEVHRIDVTLDVSVDEVCAMVNQLEDEWLVLLFHQILPSDVVERKWDYPIDDFEAILGCIQDSEIEVVRITEGVDRFSQ